jgi:bifunctional DNA-binding transcriptional regulator/antitoxin component of YhaV-PrlF toxin-antitoxin module
MEVGYMAQSLAIKVGANGRMVLPKAMRTAMGLSDSGVIVASLVDGEIRMRTMAKNIADVQAYYREHVVIDGSTDDFLAERRREAILENIKDEAG